MGGLLDLMNQTSSKTFESNSCFVFNVVLQLQEKKKDVHMSEIIDVYEQKLSALAVSGQVT